MNQVQERSVGLLAEFGKQYGLSGANMLQSLKSTYFKAGKGEEPLNDGELMAACAVCKRYGLDPFLREVFCTRAAGRLLLMVSVDGWLKQCLNSPHYDGMEAPAYDYDEKGKAISCTVTIYRKDQSHPTTYTAFMNEWYKQTPPWNQQPQHMLYIKALKNCIRIAFGISGIDMEDPQDLGEVPTYQEAPKRRLPQPAPPPVQEVPPDDPFSQEEPPMREPGEEG
jgi:hypothetical protein